MHAGRIKRSEFESAVPGATQPISAYAASKDAHGFAEWLAGVIRTLDHISRPDGATKGAAGKTPEPKTRTNEGTGAEPSHRSTPEFAWTRPRTCRPSVFCRSLWQS
ncbi:unnamed protein product [Fusarium fujikuroi]|nr:unnamed protein product [Fusarium fujikuroi]